MVSLEGRCRTPRAGHTRQETVLRERHVGWRAAVLAGYVCWALVCVFVFGGGLVVLAFFGVWTAIWLAFSSFWRRADETRKALLRQRGYY